MKPTNIEGIFKDSESGALISTDSQKLQAYKKKKQDARRINILEHEVKALKRELQEIKMLLKRD